MTTDAKPDDDAPSLADADTHLRQALRAVSIRAARLAADMPPGPLASLVAAGKAISDATAALEFFRHGDGGWAAKPEWRT